ncbi:MAG: hypothetical protein ABDI19_00605 [Armatimonadota bacterium]
MHRYGLVLWAIWLALTPISAVWAYACSCTPQLKPFCCRLQQSPSPACCTASACCSEGAAPCSDCAGCQLERVKPAPFLATSRAALDWADWVVDAPALAELSLTIVAQHAFGLPAICNHSPPQSSLTPRAPPSC